MATKIRLARGGSKKKPFYRIVVANSLAPRDGDFIEKIGTYNPLLSTDNPERINMKLDRVSYWLAKGAKPTDRVASFIERSDIDMPSWLVSDIEKRKSSRVERVSKSKE